MLSGAECPHLGSDAVSLKGLSAEMSFPMGCEFLQAWGVSGRISSGGPALLGSAGDVV